MSPSIPESLSTALAGRNFLSVTALSPTELSEFLELAGAHKTRTISPGKALTGRTVPLVFFDPSLRTRASMAVAVQRLGGFPLVLDIGGGVWAMEWRDGVIMDGPEAEHLREAVPVLASYGDIIGVRAFPKMASWEEERQDPVLTAFAELSSKPVVNLESSLEHPCQALADLLTIKERFGTTRGVKVVLTWAYHPRPLPIAVPNSFALAAALAGCDLTIAAPPAYALPEEMMTGIADAAAASGGRVDVTDSLEEAAAGANVIYAKSWGAPRFYGNKDRDLETRSHLKDWRVTSSVMRRTDDGIFLHCLPVRRGVIVDAEVLDSPRSLVIQEAANRLHVQTTLLSLIAGGLS